MSEKLEAKLVPWSSVVGQSVAIHKPSGEVVCQITICGASTYPKKETAEALMGLVVAAVNQFEGEFDV